MGVRASRVAVVAALVICVSAAGASAATHAPAPARGTFWQGVPVIRAAPIGTAQTPAVESLAASFWARPQVRWAVANGWVSKAGPKNFGPSTLVHRLGAARVLALAWQRWNRWDEAQQAHRLIRPA